MVVVFHILELGCSPHPNPGDLSSYLNIYLFSFLLNPYWILQAYKKWVEKAPVGSSYQSGFFTWHICLLRVTLRKRVLRAAFISAFQERTLKKHFLKPPLKIGTYSCHQITNYLQCHFKRIALSRESDRPHTDMGSLVLLWFFLFAFARKFQSCKQHVCTDHLRFYIFPFFII